MKPAAAATPAKPSPPAIDDRLMDAAGGLYEHQHHAPIHVMLADGVELDDVLRALRDKVDLRTNRPGVEVVG